MNRHFKWLRRRKKWDDAPAGSVFTLVGKDIVDLPAFICALGEAVNGPGGYFGDALSLFWLQDAMYGGFGVTRPFTIRICGIDVCRKSLNGQALAEWARRRIASLDFLDDEGREWLLEAERAGRAGTRTMLDEVLDVLRSHGVTIEEGDAPEHS